MFNSPCLKSPVEVPHVRIIDKDAVDLHVVSQRQVLVIRKIQKTVEVQQVQYTGRKPTLRISISATFPSPRGLSLPDKPVEVTGPLELDLDDYSIAVNSQISYALDASVTHFGKDLCDGDVAPQEQVRQRFRLQIRFASLI